MAKEKRRTAGTFYTLIILCGGFENIKAAIFCPPKNEVPYSRRSRQFMEEAGFYQLIVIAKNSFLLILKDVFYIAKLYFEMSLT